MTWIPVPLVFIEQSRIMQCLVVLVIFIPDSPGLIVWYSMILGSSSVPSPIKPKDKKSSSCEIKIEKDSIFLCFWTW